MNQTVRIYKKEIVERFKACQTIEDLADLLNQIDAWQHAKPDNVRPSQAGSVLKIENVMSAEDMVSLGIYFHKDMSIKAVKYFLYAKKNKYRTFEIAKKSGGTRTIKSPHPFLKRIQRLLNICFHACFYPMPTATGFVPGRSIVTNAQKHTGKKYVYNIDLKDFFPSINFGRVRAVLHKVPPFQLHADIAHIVANLCCEKGCLPQGAPTSPTLSNIVCQRLDAKLYHLSQEMNFTFSRYADDITISCNKNIFTEAFKIKLLAIIEAEGFQINPKKERLQRNHVKKEDGTYIRERQEVTGIIVNEKTNVPRHFVRNLRATIHNWEKYGYEIAAMLHRHFYPREKGFLRYGGTIPAIEEVVHGKIEYLGMVKGKEDDTYRLMKLQFDSLCIKKEMTAEDLEIILDIWKKHGIKKAADRFYSRKNLKQEQT